jgi:transposase-like protein
MFKKEGMSRGNAGATERVPEGTEGTSGVGPATRRWTAARKLDAVMCVLRGQSLDAVTRKYSVSLHDLTKWRDKVLSGAESALKTKESDETTDAEKKALLSKIGEITMSNELLLEKIKKLENGVPFHLRR